MLTKLRKANTLIQPVGLKENVKHDYWIHMIFCFSGQTSEVTVESFWVTDSHGTPVSLSKMSYTEVQFISEAMAEEFSYQADLYYFELEAAYYNEKQCG